VAYADKFDREVELDLSEAQELVIKSFMKEGELQFREKFIESLSKEVSDYLDEVDYEPNEEWVNGVNYAIHLLREADLDGSER